MQAVSRFKLGAAAFWLVRSEQERKFLTVGACAVALALIYSILIAPAVEGRAELEQSLPLLRQEAAEIQALARQAGELARQAPVQLAPMSRQSLTTSLAARGLTPQSISLTGDYAKLQFGGVPFASLINWLDGVRRENRIAVQDANIVAQATPGMVEATFTLHQSAGASK